MVSFTSFTVTGEKPLMPVNHTHPSIHLIFPFIAWYRLIKTINRPFLIRFPPHKFKWLLAPREISSSCKSSQSKHGRSTDIRTNEIEGRFLEGVFFCFKNKKAAMNRNFVRRVTGMWMSWVFSVCCPFLYTARPVVGIDLNYLFWSGHVQWNIHDLCNCIGFNSSCKYSYVTNAPR